jgi:O-antigen/teichoic acid export membrane protein
VSRIALIARNTSWNLLGAVLPIPVALVCIPLLVRELGVERFGVLGVAWTLLGYFGMFDFGLAQSTTRFVSRAVADGRTAKVAALAAGSVLLHGVLGLVGGAVFFLLAPWLASSVFNVPPALIGETRTALYWLAASVPAMVVTAAMRGMLEGLQRFDVVNLIRIPASMVNYAGPAVALYFGTGLPLVVAVIVVARFAVLAAYAAACLRALPQPRGGALAKGELVALASYGGWLTASNFVNPLIIAADRVIIAAAISAAAVAFYVTPYEVITKTWILSASLLAALFPVFSGMAASEPGAIRAACRSAELYLLALATPVVALVLGSADLLLEWWLGVEFREQSTAVAQLLALGILVNVVAQVPLTALNATGRADVTTMIALVELPIYVLAIWFAAVRYGINGVAAVWAARACLDALALFLAAHVVLPADARADAPGRVGLGGGLLLCSFLAAAWFSAYGFGDSVAMRFAMLAIVLAVLVVWEWRVLLVDHERRRLTELCSRLITNQAR